MFLDHQQTKIVNKDIEQYSPSRENFPRMRTKENMDDSLLWNLVM
jgi:hypothetical protein